MSQKIQLLHPAGKKAVSIDKVKYDLLKRAIIAYLVTHGESTHTEIVKAISEDFNMQKIQFAGSVEWHLEWVKLDLEARKEIKRIDDRPNSRFKIA